MASVSKNVTIFPAAAAAAGCAASCAGTQTDYQDGSWLREYQLSAAAQGAWNFVSFEWDQTITTSEGSTTTTHDTSRLNPDGLREFRTYFGSASIWEEVTVSNIVANFSQTQTYTITTASSPVGGGTTTGDGTYSAGASCTITATPAAGYTFVRWEKNGSQVSTNASYTFTVSESATYTAVFATGVTVTLVATSFGRVRFEGDAAVHGTVSKSFAPGELVTIEAVTEYGSIFKQWRESYSGTVLTNARLIIFANDYVWTATFYHLYTAHARLAADIDTPCPNGQVRVVATETTTAWGRDVRYEKIDIQTLTIEQQSTGGGWTFVKWRYYSRYYERWYESTDATLRLVNYGYDIYALFQRTPTHLLVNSSTKESPAKLVYDPATNKLVADY